MTKAAHYRGTYDVRSRRLVKMARARDLAAARGECEPTRCWRCKLTLAEHPAHRNGRRPKWTAGHVVDSDPRSPLAPEASVCNYRAGAELGNRLRAASQAMTSKRW